MSKQSEHLAKTKTQDGVSLGGAFWASSDPFSKKKDNLSDAEKKTLTLIEEGKAEIAEMHNKNAQYLKTVSEAAESDSLRDKIWLCKFENLLFIFWSYINFIKTLTTDNFFLFFFSPFFFLPFHFYRY